jgi:hypothetical protein
MLLGHVSAKCYEKWHEKLLEDFKIGLPEPKLDVEPPNAMISLLNPKP